MNRPMSIALLVVGIVLLVFGLNAHGSFASETKEALTGSPTDKSLWLLGLGILGIVIGGLGAFRRAR